MEKRDTAAAHHEWSERAPSISQEDAEPIVTLKTWLVVIVSVLSSAQREQPLKRFQVLSASYGISFWPVPFFSQIQTQMSASFGSEPAMGTW